MWSYRCIACGSTVEGFTSDLCDVHSELWQKYVQELRDTHNNHMPDHAPVHAIFADWVCIQTVKHWYSYRKKILESLADEY